MAAETLRDIIRHGAEAYGEQTAFRYKVKKEIIDKSYNEVNLDSMAVSRAVEALGMKGKHIAVIGTTSYQWITTYFGIVNSGSVAVPIDAQLPAEAVCELLNRADVEMLVYDELRSDVAGVVRGKCPGISHVVFMQARETMGDVLSLSRLIALHHTLYLRHHRKEQGSHAEPQEPDGQCGLPGHEDTCGNRVHDPAAHQPCLLSDHGYHKGALYRNDYLHQ